MLNPKSSHLQSSTFFSFFCSSVQFSALVSSPTLYALRICNCAVFSGLFINYMFAKELSAYIYSLKV